MPDQWHWLSTNWQPLLTAAQDFLSTEQARHDADPTCAPLPHPPKLDNILKALKAEEPPKVSGARRRSSVNLGHAELVIRDFLNSSIPENNNNNANSNSNKVVPEDEVSEAAKALSFTTGVTVAVIGEYSPKPTDTRIHFEPRLEEGWIEDEVVLKDVIRDMFILGKFIEEFLQPLSATLYYIPQLLFPLWGPFALAEMVGVELGPAWARSVSFYTFILSSVGGSLFTLILMLDFNPTVLRILISRCKGAIALNIGSRLVYTVASAVYYPNIANLLWLASMFSYVFSVVFGDALMATHMFRFTKEGFTKMHSSNSLAGWLNVAKVFSLVLECARHYTVLYVLAEDTTNLVKFFPDTKFTITNISLMNISFATSMILFIKFEHYRMKTGGTRFILLNSAMNMHAVYKED
jgi:hypothetical protein